ncbi:hypothetical protein BHE90_005275 [Fusarium euwallaceae]|uniref:Uncharacterized protein n=1 Tax=Fusarium euwallaceae TaxID=1147111 RepID=A0A430LX03_9HYPO|nr:hypothetical protein BHE90_005275 [Fusarium euwallaceae]
MGTLTASELLPLFGRKSQTQALDPLPSTLPSTISNPEQLPVTSATNDDGNQGQVSIFAMPGSEAEEVPLWQFFKEAPVNDSPGPSSMLDLTTVTLDDVSEQATEEEAALQQERDDEDYQALSFLLDDYKTLHQEDRLYEVRRYPGPQRDREFFLARFDEDEPPKKKQKIWASHDGKAYL